MTIVSKSTLRWAALIPRVSARFLYAQGDTAYLDLRPDAPDQLDTRLRNSVSWQINAHWDLDNLLFDARELAVEHATRRRHRARQQLIKRVTRLYYERQRLQTLLGCREPTLETFEERLSLQARLKRTTAQLDGLTAGILRRSWSHSVSCEDAEVESPSQKR